MKNLLIFLFLILTTSVFAQIKEQYVAQSNKNTTIVIKEARASDEEILAQNFNLDDYRVGDVIEISTAVREPVKKTAKVSSASSASRTRVKRKKKKSFSLFKKSYKGTKRKRKSNYLKCYSF